jgi:hypothetical protein
LAIHCAFVFSVLPIRSSLPMQIISMSVVMVFTWLKWWCLVLYSVC